MAKSKCKQCSSTLPSGDKHAYCDTCRKNKKGDDPCVKGRSCKFCENMAKAATEKRKSECIDDSILDEDNPQKLYIKSLAVRSRTPLPTRFNRLLNS